MNPTNGITCTETFTQCNKFTNFPTTGSQQFGILRKIPSIRKKNQLFWRNLSVKTAKKKQNLWQFWEISDGQDCEAVKIRNISSWMFQFEKKVFEYDSSVKTNLVVFED